jgi:hypothetical protein
MKKGRGSMTTRPAGIQHSRGDLQALVSGWQTLAVVLAIGCSSKVSPGSSALGGSNGNGGMLGAAGVGTSNPVGSGGIVGAGGVLGAGGLSVPNSAGVGGKTTVNSSSYGKSCNTNQDCPADSTCCSGSSETCDGTRLPLGGGPNPGEFVVSTDGFTVTDTITGLVWQRDGSGMRPGCSGAEIVCPWDEANAYCAGLTLGGFSDWRLPGRHELLTIVDLDFRVGNPPIDATPFPNTASEAFWTSSLFAGSSGSVWYMDFRNYALEGHALPGNGLRVRCVRGRRCSPTSRFLILEGGIVRDLLTNLEWQQASSPTKIPWEEAVTYCSDAGSGFRLPTRRELDSIVDLTVVSGAAINQTAFPNTPAEGFWTILSDGPHAPAWGIYFDFADSFSGQGYFRARCVR